MRLPFTSTVTAEKGWRVPTSRPVRVKPKTVAWKSLPPDLVIRLSAPPVKSPSSTSKGASCTATCSMASSEIGPRLVDRPPVFRPKSSWLRTPSMVMRFERGKEPAM